MTRKRKWRQDDTRKSEFMIRLFFSFLTADCLSQLNFSVKPTITFMYVSKISSHKRIFQSFSFFEIPPPLPLTSKFLCWLDLTLTFELPSWKITSYVCSFSLTCATLPLDITFFPFNLFKKTVLSHHLLTIRMIILRGKN